MAARKVQSPPMEDLYLFNKVRFKLAGPFYAFLYYTAHRRFIGATLAFWIKLASILLVFATLLRGRSLNWTLAALALVVIIFILYWKGKRDDYIGFVPDSAQVSRDQQPPIADEEKIALRATGPFSVKDRESFVLLRPAYFQKESLGDSDRPALLRHEERATPHLQHRSSSIRPEQKVRENHPVATCEP